MRKKMLNMCLRRFLIASLIFIFALPPASFAWWKADNHSIEKQFKKHLRDGKIYYKKKLYEEAIEELEKASTLYPKKKSVKKLIEKARIKLEEETLFNAWEERVKKEKSEKPKKPDLTLDECITIAMVNHLPLKIAEKQLKLARFRVLEATRNMGPTVTAKWEGSLGDMTDQAGATAGTTRHYTGSKMSIEGKQPVFYGGELVFSVKQAKVNLEIVTSDYDRVKNELVLQVKKAYYSLDKAKKALRIQKKLYKRAKGLYDIAKIGSEAGVIPQVEFLKVASQHNQIDFQAISAGEDLSLANLLLQQAMNIDEEVKIAGTKEPEIIEINLEDCFNLAYLNRAEIKIGLLSLEYFEYEKKIRRARSDWPRVDFMGMYGNMREDYEKDDMPSNRTGEDPRGFGPEYYFGAKVSLPFWGSTLGYSFTKESWQPVVRTVQETAAATSLVTLGIFDKLSDISGVKEAELEYMRSQEEINKREQEITLEVKEVFFKYKKAILLMNVAKSKIVFQSKQVEIFEIRRELGEIQYSDVLEETIKLAEEEFSYIQAISDYYISIALLNKAIGIDDYFKV